MEAFLPLVVVVLLAVVFRGQSRLRRRNQALENRLHRLERRLEELAGPVDTAGDRELIATEAPPLPSAPEPPAPEPPPLLPETGSRSGSVPTPPPRRPSAPPPPLLRRAPRAPGTPARSPSPRPPRPAQAAPHWWRRLERLFIENWTGILGVAVVVAGVTFAVINVALRMDAFQRFWLTVAASAALAAPSFVLGQRLRWRNLSHWMRSGGAALFLFACAAGGGFPELGLRWLSDPRQGLALLTVGVAANLALAGIARTQTIASLHVVLGLIPQLIVLTQQPGLATETLAIASVVALVGLVLPLRRPWDRHLLVVTLAYAFCHGVWFLSCAGLLEASPDLRLHGALAAVLVFGGGALLNHVRLLGRADGMPTRLAPLPLALELSNWGALALALLLYPRQAGVRAVALALAAAVAALLALRARRAGAGWLRQSGTLIAQSLAMGAVISLHPLIANHLVLVAILLVETLLYLRLGIAEQDPILRRLGWIVVNLTGAVLVLAGLQAGWSGASPQALQWQNGAVLIAAAALLTAVQRRLHRLEVPLPLPPLLGWLVGALAFVGTMVCPPHSARELLALVVIGALLVVGRPQRPPGLLAGATAAAVAAHAVGWTQALLTLAPRFEGAVTRHTPGWEPQAYLPHLWPLAVLALLALAQRRATAVSGVGWALFNGTGVVLLIATCLSAGTPGGAAALALNAGLLVAWAALTTLVQLLMRRFGIPQPWPALMGWLSPALVLVAVLVGTPAEARELQALLALGALLLVARSLRPEGLLAGTAVAVTLTHAVSWPALLLQQPWGTGPLLGHLLPLTALAVVTLGAGGRGPVRLLGIDLLALDLGLAAYLLFEPLSPLIPGVLWLLLSLVALELSDRQRGSAATHALLMGLLYLAAFAASYLLVINQSPALVSIGSLSLPTRLLIGLFAVAVALYWWFFSPREELRGQPLWRAVHPWFLELSLLGTAVMILAELEALWRPVAWSLLALALVSDPCRRLFAARVKVYAVVVYWVAVATVVAMLSTLESPSTLWFEQPQATALVAIALQMAFIVVSHRSLDLEELRRPGGGPLLAWIGNRVARHRNHWLYSPMFAAVAYSLYLRYDPSLHTLLWTVEAFAIYVLSVVLRENSFRAIALVALGICLLRLMAIDLAQVDLGLRGVVFIGVGLLMLAMNAIFSRFRSRFE